MFIVFTGLDGTGTSTIAEKLALKDKNAILLKTPSPEYKDREIIDDRVRKYSKTGHFLYYLSSSVFMSDYIRATCDYKSNNVYCVRYLIDTFVSNKVSGLPIKLTYDILGNEILKPDLTVFVSTDEDIRQKRITSRGKSELDKVLDEESKRIAFLDEFEKALDKESTYYFDNSSSLEDELNDKIEQLYNYIKKLQKEYLKGVGNL